MALAINIDDLLNKQRIESNRIEFKKGWNPVSIYHSVCAFANDFDDRGGVISWLALTLTTRPELPFGLLKEYPSKRLMISFRIWSVIITR